MSYSLSRLAMTSPNCMYKAQNRTDYMSHLKWVDPYSDNAKKATVQLRPVLDCESSKGSELSELLRLANQYTTQQEISDICGVSYSIIAKMIQGVKKNIKLKTAEKIRDGIKLVLAKYGVQ